MLHHSQLPLAAPPIDRPAATDLMTMRAFDKVLRTQRNGCLLLALVLIGPVALGFALPSGALRAGVLGVAAALWALTTFLVTPWLVRYLTWLRGIRRSARSITWRQVRAGLVRGGPGKRSCVVVVEDGATQRMLRLHDIPWAMQLAVAYAGRVWLLGPDVAGRQAAAPIGVRMPFRAEAVTELPPGERPAEPASGQTGSAMDDQVTAAFASALTRTGRLATVGSLLVALSGGLIAMAAPVPGLLWALPWLALFGVAIRANRFLPRMLASLRSGPWTPVSARLASWPDSPRGTASITGRIQLVDGRTLSVELPRADENLVANVQATGHLWFAGQPQPGGTCAVGVPGLPLLSLARVRTSP